MKPGLYRRSKEERERAMALVNQRVIQRDRACVEKVSYPDQNHARAAAKVAALNTEHSFDTYHCPFGDHYHLTQIAHGEVDRDEGWQ